MVKYPLTGKPMVLIEISENPNCASVEQRVFHDLAPAQPVVRVRLSGTNGEAEWHDVTGWTAAGAACPALIQKVDDSGEGVAFLVNGGDAGLRLKPAATAAAWRLDDPAQRGEPFLLVTDLEDVQHG